MTMPATIPTVPERKVTWFGVMGSGARPFTRMLASGRQMRRLRVELGLLRRELGTLRRDLRVFAVTPFDGRFPLDAGAFGGRRLRRGHPLPVLFDHALRPHGVLARDPAGVGLHEAEP